MSQKQYSTDSPLSRIKLTEAQKTVQQLIDEYDITFVEGVAGTGKSLSVLHKFVSMMNSNKNVNIFIIRTPVEAGPDQVGFLPDRLSDKMAPHFGAAQQLLMKLLGKSNYEANVGEGKRIQYMIPNYALGHTFDNALIFIDEAQQLQPHILKLLLERIGKYSKCVVAGDNSQLYLADDKVKNRQALADALSRFFEVSEPDEDGERYLEARFPGVAYHKFEIEDVQRSEIVKTVIRAYSS